MMKRRLAMALLAFAAALPALAADWPAKPITLIVPFPAGGSTDALARLIGQRLSEKLGQPVVVDNRAGAGGNLGTDMVAKAAPDGYTLALSTSGPLANNKYLYKNLRFDPQKDLTPVIAIGEIPMGIAVSPALKVDSLQGLLERARAQPGKVSIANPGNGTIGHLTAELLKSQAKVEALGVPYKGDTPAITDTVGGNVDAVSMPITSLVPQIQAGKLKGLAVTSRQRFAGLPQVPTAIEQGIPVEATVWMAIVGPKGLPEAVVTRLNTEINAVIATPEARARLEQYGAAPIGGSPQQLVQLMASDSAKWKKVIETTNITLD
ncbi:tripartite tricarboxylate transporter substrate binding protein [Pseudacidovorax sp. RU35E]|uniref:Bug family tripartite tricarboxylate transporter substrate binding protein n=1 Tax=Pseudacidovorax sp. RU35E TaxID=1907403 RepID=UPI000955AF14|nr:tripartite tricarboxylate transporter substrate binding protein [Pseudacidovorax sp. RU35E]SIR59554.1 Tripartite-type tricarboxylate transporter, receptor component TctC [Pseudacidovorax sp. RU35E]